MIKLHENNNLEYYQVKKKEYTFPDGRLKHVVLALWDWQQWELDLITIFFWPIFN